MTPCFFLFGASNHPYIPFHFEEMIFPLVIIVPHEVVGIVEELALELVGVLLLGGSPNRLQRECGSVDTHFMY